MRMRRYGTLSLALLFIYVYAADTVSDEKKYLSIPTLKNLALRIVGVHYYMNQLTDNSNNIPQGILDQIRLYASRLRIKEMELFQEHRHLASKKAIRAIVPHDNETILVANADNDVMLVTVKQDALIEKSLFCTNDALRKRQINSLASLTSEVVAVGINSVEIWRHKDNWRRIKNLGLHIYKGDVSRMHLIDDTTIITNDEGDSSIHIWKSVLGDTEHTMLVGHRGPVNCFLIRDAQTFLSGSRDGTIREWKKQNGIWYEHAKIGWLDAIYDAHISTSQHRGIREINYKTRDISWMIENYKKSNSPLPDGHTDSIVALASLSDNSIISSSRDGSVKMWHSDDHGRWIAMHKDQKLQATNMHVFSQRYIIAVNSDGQVVLWDKDAEQSINVMRSEPSIRLYNFVSLENDKLLATGFDDRMLMWDLGLKRRLSHDQYQLLTDVISTEKSDITSAQKRDFTQAIARLFYLYPDTQLRQETVRHRDRDSKQQESESLALLLRAQHDVHIGQILSNYIND